MSQQWMLTAIGSRRGDIAARQSVLRAAARNADTHRYREADDSRHGDFRVTEQPDRSVLARARECTWVRDLVDAAARARVVSPTARCTPARCPANAWRQAALVVSPGRHCPGCSHRRSILRRSSGERPALARRSSPYCGPSPGAAAPIVVVGSASRILLRYRVARADG